MAQARLEKLVADIAGISRSEAKTVIKNGRVTVNGAVCILPEAKTDVTADISIDGVSGTYREHRYIMMNKPSGVLSATEDRNMKTVLDLLPEKYRRAGLFPAGRLDRDSEGLLLLTDDGNFCHNVISPKKNVKKVYYIETDRPMTEADIALFRSGAPLGGGETARPAELEILGGNSSLVTISEGKYHQVKRMAKAAGKTVTRLKRLKIGALSLDESLSPGEFRELEREEAKAVFGGK